MPESQKSPESAKKLFYGLFIFPLLIAVGMAVFLCTVVLMTHEDQSPEALMASIRKTTPSKRWQKAFELSNEINRNPERAASSSLYKEMISIVKDKDNFDSKTRGYMAIALARFEKPEAEMALIQSLAQTNDVDYEAYAMWALGQMKSQRAASVIQNRLASDSADLRKVAAYVLGVVGGPDAVSPLLPLLTDASDEVQWNAALALSRLGNAKGEPILFEMLDRERLQKDFKMDERQIESAMINAMKGLSLIRSQDSNKILETLAKHDKNMKIRQQAIQTLNEVKSKKA